jgi:crotonobetainyl-CoA hydratase
MTDMVRTERRGAVLEITLDRPPANAIDATASRQMGEVFADFAADKSLRVAILTGSGDKFFSAGWDLKAAARAEAEGSSETESDYGPGGFGGITEFADLDKPVIAAVNGYCVAGGFEVALACDLMVAADHSVFFLSEVNVGLIPAPIGIKRLIARLPRALALELLYTGRRMDAAEAYACGLVNRVVPGDRVMDTAREIAQAIADAAPLAVAAVKEIALATEYLTVAETLAMRHENRLPSFDRVYQSEDAKEGPRAFAEKRKPVWRGR